jgi:hypothetical protein
MAVAHDAKSNSQGSGVTSVSFTHTPTGTPTAVAITALSYYGASATASCTYGGTTATTAFSQIFEITTNCGGTTFGLANPPSGAKTVVVNFTVSAYPIVIVQTVTGSDTGTCFDTSNSLSTGSGGAGTSASMTVTGGAAADLVHMVAFTALSGASVLTNTTTGSTNLYANITNGGDTVTGDYVGGAASVTVSYTGNVSTAWILVGASFKAAAAVVAAKGGTLSFMGVG